MSVNVLHGGAVVPGTAQQALPGKPTGNMKRS